uniref:uncharacterized protein LOC113198774 n=1 Tax=Urocitellus parryii TaxID=9999 RepID=UPI000E558E3D|nr:uncharacterized protein LOC113198774 [Urocitellus parryii]
MEKMQRENLVHGSSEADTSGMAELSMDPIHRSIGIQNEGRGLGSREPHPQEATSKCRQAGPEAESDVPFPIHFFSGRESAGTGQGGTRAKGGELCPAPPRTLLGSRIGSRAARSARTWGQRDSRAGRDPSAVARPPESSPRTAQTTLGGGPPAQGWHARAGEPRANSTTCGAAARTPSSRGDQDPGGEAGGSLSGPSSSRELGNPFCSVFFFFFLPLLSRPPHGWLAMVSGPRGSEGTELARRAPGRHPVKNVEYSERKTRKET